MAEDPTSDWSGIGGDAERFRRAWRDGRRPRIEEFLAEAPEPWRTTLFRELIRVEGELRRLDGEAPTIDEYRRRFPGHERDIATIFVATTATDTSLTDAGPTVGAPMALPLASTPPTELANHPDYAIVRELGQGGMGVVYLAHNRIMARPEVLKVIGTQIAANPEMIERFLREIRAVARLRHPNIVNAYSAFHCGGSLVFAMEYAEGLDLRRLVRAQGPIPVRHACNFVHQAALGMQHAHEEGMVHRDIKPGNLMLSHHRRRALIKVLDFGLSKVVSEQNAAELGFSLPALANDRGEHLTCTGTVLGTPEFIAPEQIDDTTTVDIRADIYSLGCTLYYLLAGHPPFRLATIIETLEAHRSKTAPPLDRVRPEVPAELAALVARMMAKEPGRRVQSPGEVAELLVPFYKKPAAPAGSEGEVWSGLIDLWAEAEEAEGAVRPIAAPAPSRSRARRQWPAAVAAAAAVVLACGLIAAWAAVAFRGAPAQRDWVGAEASPGTAEAERGRAAGATLDRPGPRSPSPPLPGPAAPTPTRVVTTAAAPGVPETGSFPPDANTVSMSKSSPPPAAVALGHVRRGADKGTTQGTVEKGTAQGTVEKEAARGAELPRDAVDDPEWLRTRMEKVRRRFDLPDLGAAIVIGDKVVAASVVGVRKYGTQIAATRDDPFHLGSITKVMSATLVGMFVDDGLLRWDMTMEEMYPELLGMMQPGYRQVTVLQLLSHTSGLPAATSASIETVTARGSNPVERRYEWVKAAIIDPPAAPPGTKTIYTGGAVYVIAYIERKTRKSYEQLMQERLFGPLGMTTGGISDFMASEGKVDAPWGHRQSNGKTIPIPSDHHSPINGLQPVGGGYCSMIDLGKFLALHIQGARGRGRLLRPATFRVLQTAAPGGNFAPGWSVEHLGWTEGKALFHSGSTGIYLATCGVALDEGYGLCVGTNAAGEPRADDALGEVVLFLTTRVNHGRRRLLRDVPAWKRPVPPKPDVFLDDLIPLRATVGYSTFRVGRSGDGKPLMLDGDVYTHGLGVHAPSQVSYAVNPSYRRFVARVGPEERGWQGTVVAEVYFDETLVDRSPLLRAGDPPWNINIAIPPRPSRKAPRRIHLVLTDGGDGRHSDWGEWVEAGFITGKDGGEARSIGDKTPRGDRTVREASGPARSARESGATSGNPPRG